MQTQIVLGNRYRCLEELGSGSMGKVYRAEDRLTGHAVALKRVTVTGEKLEFRTSGSLDQRMALAQEFQTLASLHHPHIIEVADYGFDSEKQPYFTMRLLENAKTILDAARSQLIQNRVHLLIQLLQALSYLHQRNILHRDLKPSNILVDQHGQVQVLDFGLAIRVNTAEQIAGTLYYIAPEVLRGSTPTTASDLYAVGVIAYEMFAGHHPFLVNGTGNFITDVFTLTPDANALDIAPELAQVIVRLLEKEDYNRYQDAYEVIEALCTALNQPIPEESEAIRESFLQAAEFIGRDDELEQLTAALDDALKGQGSVWLIGGESGIGKSRLVAELRTRALVRGIQVFNGQAAEGSSTYLIWRDIMRRMALIDDISPTDAAILQEIVPDIEAVRGREITEKIPALVDQAAQQRLSGTIVRVLRHLTRPTLLILEDLQWAGGESIAVLKQLIAQMGGQPLHQPLLVIANYRSDEAPGLPDQLGAQHHILLERLTHQAIADLSQSMLGEAGKREYILDLLQRETEGNILFLIEVIRVLAEDAGSLSEIGNMTLPASVFAGGIQTLIRRRLARVPEWGQGLLRLAAVIGRVIDPVLLKYLEPEADLQQWLTVCANAAVLSRQDNVWQFSHDKLRETLVVDLDEAERIMLNRRIAVAIEAIYPDDTRYVRRLFRHWNAANDLEKVLQYAHPAARQMEPLYAKGLVLLKEVLPRIDELPEPERFDHQKLEMLLRIAKNSYLLGNFQEALVYYERTVELAARIHHANILVRGNSGLGVTYNRLNDYEKAIYYANKALNMAEQNADDEQIIIALQDLSMIEMMAGNYAVAWDHLQRALPLVEILDDPVQSVRLYVTMGNNATFRSDWELARTLYEKAMPDLEKLGNVHHMATILNNMGIVAMNQEDYDAAEAYLERSLQIRKDTDSRIAASQPILNLGNLAQKRGQYEKALKYYYDALHSDMEINDLKAVATDYARIASVLAKLRRFDEAHQMIHEGLKLAQQISAAPSEMDLMSAVLDLRIAEGRYIEAAHLLGMFSVHPQTVEGFWSIDEQQQELGQYLPPDELIQAMEKGKTLDWQAAVQSFLNSTTGIDAQV